MVLSVFEELRERQRNNLLEAITSLHRHAIYAIIHPELTVNIEIKTIIKQLEELYREEYIE